MPPSTYRNSPEPFDAEALSYAAQRGVNVDYRTALYRAARMRQAEEVARLIHLVAQAIARPFRGLVARFQAWRSYREAYEELAGLTERELADIGLTKADIEQVAHGLWQPAARGEAPKPVAEPKPAAVSVIHPTTPKLAA